MKRLASVSLRFLYTEWIIILHFYWSRITHKIFNTNLNILMLLLQSFFSDLLIIQSIG